MSGIRTLLCQHTQQRVLCQQKTMTPCAPRALAVLHQPAAQNGTSHYDTAADIGSVNTAYMHQ